jgi:hypothetical protein
MTHTTFHVHSVQSLPSVPNNQTENSLIDTPSIHRTGILIIIEGQQQKVNKLQSYTTVLYSEQTDTVHNLRDPEMTQNPTSAETQIQVKYLKYARYNKINRL